MGRGRFKYRVKKFGCDLIGNGEIPRISEKKCLENHDWVSEGRKEEHQFQSSWLRASAVMDVGREG